MMDIDRVSVAVLNNSTAVLQSREVSCALNAKLFIAYFRTEKANVKVCIEKRCVSTNDSQSGAIANISEGPGLAILRSPQFKLSRPLELQIEVYQSTFGSQTFLCGDDFSSLYNCQPILGPKIESPKKEKIILPLDQDAQNFTIVAVHDKFMEFGAAKFIISNIEILDENGKLLC
ncbi:unnamed protein product [Litomosoides sigmodontis]|uniref:CUB domain-containing protein n=1 Tax=Litomosoides sigmodontis TaxID=42156 RepID=A0A3P6T3Z3_LITSI|nr:unnamed protein product [Litomosoides sigmodontis]